MGTRWSKEEEDKGDILEQQREVDCKRERNITH